MCEFGVSTNLDKIGASAVILGGIDAKGVEYTGLDKALADSDAEVRLFSKPDAFVTRRMGVALATADNVTVARSKAVKAAGFIKVQ